MALIYVSLFVVVLFSSVYTLVHQAHDYVHGTDKFVQPLRHFGGLAAGYSATMWSNKHNLHHAKTNEVGVAKGGERGVCLGHVVEESPGLGGGLAVGCAYSLRVHVRRFHALVV